MLSQPLGNSEVRLADYRNSGTNVEGYAGTHGDGGFSIERRGVENVVANYLQRTIIKGHRWREIDLSTILDASSYCDLQACDVFVSEMISSFDADAKRA